MAARAAAYDLIFFEGWVTDIEIHALYAHHTGQSADRIARDTERDNFLSAAEARDYGLIDGVLAPDDRA